jgi:hypothetical protein
VGTDLSESCVVAIVMLQLKVSKERLQRASANCSNSRGLHCLFSKLFGASQKVQRAHCAFKITRDELPFLTFQLSVKDSRKEVS